MSERVDLDRPIYTPRTMNSVIEDAAAIADERDQLRIQLTQEQQARREAEKDRDRAREIARMLAEDDKLARDDRDTLAARVRELTAVLERIEQTAHYPEYVVPQFIGQPIELINHLGTIACAALAEQEKLQ